MPFGKKKNKQSLQQNRNDFVAKAVITPAVTTMLADGDISETELAQLANLCSFSPIFFAYENREVEHMIKTIIHEVLSYGVHATIQQSAKMLTPELSETALCFSMRIALADGYLDDGEKAALAVIAQTLNIRQEIFGQIFEIVAMMQRSPQKIAA